jgi:hypothetical protein
MCNHKWVDTGMTATWCDYCGIKGDWRMGEVILRPPEGPFHNDLLRFGLPIRYNASRVGSSWGVPFIEVFDVWVDLPVGSLSSGWYDSLRIEQAYSDPTLVLVGEHNGTKGWERVPCSDVAGLVRFIESRLPANTPA